MADTKASAFTALTAFASGDKICVIDDPSGTPIQKTATIDVLAAYFGTVGFGSTTTIDADVTTLTGTPKLTVIADNNAALGCVMVGTGNNAAGPAIAFLKTRAVGASNANTVVQNGDYAGNFIFYAAGGASYHSCGIIRVVIDGTPGLSDMPGRMSFLVTEDGASSPTERLSILPNGSIGISTQTAPVANAAKAIIFGDNGANPTLGSNTAALFAKDVAGTVEMFACDEAGNVTQISPHSDLDEAEAAGIVLEPADLAPAVAYSMNIYTGVHTYRYTGPSGNTQIRQLQRGPLADWDDVQEKLRLQHARRKQAYQRAVEQHAAAVAAYEQAVAARKPTDPEILPPVLAVEDPGVFVKKHKPRWK
ncbi:MAG: hypothetical protein E6Q97_17395 [Desulfurellales bacterium]|nr:MAG: hypothetical protein E6Q97_17395 [Desulfurellales bacterium]